MLLSFGRTNFPFIAVEEIGVEVHLLPVTKQQFELFVADSGPLEQARYQKLLALNPALGPEESLIEARERLFVSGVLPAEARTFARWLGEGFDLPTVKEWRGIYNVFKRTSLPRHGLAAELAQGPAAAFIAQWAEEMRLSHARSFAAARRSGRVGAARPELGRPGLAASPISSQFVGPARPRDQASPA